MTKRQVRTRFHRTVASSIYDLIHYETLSVPKAASQGDTLPVTAGQIAKLTREVYQ